MSLLDIGCGFLLIEAAKKYKVHGTGITLSKEQYSEFQRRIREEHLEDMIIVELMDYRDLPKYGKNFDWVVSVGMIEHVGRGNYEEFFDCVKVILKQGEIFLLHFISALKEYPGDAWIKKYIFPGGVVPSLRYFGLPTMGTRGAAAATVVGQIIAMLLGLCFNLAKNTDVQFNFKSIELESYYFKGICTVGIPTIIM